MATKVSQLFSSIFLLFLLLPLLFRTNSSNSEDEKSSAFEFLKHLQDCHKGDKVKGHHELKICLENFGYLNYLHSKNFIHATDDFDDLLESAIKTYQLNYHLKVTRVLDSQTISNMMMSRCGVPDIFNGTCSMRVGKKRHRDHEQDNIHTISHYTFFEGNQEWPASKTHLTYGFSPGTHPGAMHAVAQAFDQWASATHFTFSHTQDYGNADLKIGFHSDEHGDGHPFDGQGGTLAHAWSPTAGRVHYDADEVWCMGPVPGALDLETVALHEMGHLLGLGHSSVKDAILFPSVSDGVTKGLHGHDIQGIQALYNV